MGKTFSGELDSQTMTTEHLHGVEQVPEVDQRMASEIAEFVAERAQLFEDHECRAWALTDFGVWAVLAGRSPRLALEPAPPLPGADVNAA